jgi:hypothetical protein
MLSALDDAPGIVVGHRRIRVPRSGRLRRFFDIDKEQSAFLAMIFADAEQHGKAQAAERAASFHPIGRIEHFDRGGVRARTQGGD